MACSRSDSTVGKSIALNTKLIGSNPLALIIIVNKIKSNYNLKKFFLSLPFLALTYGIIFYFFEVEKSIVSYLGAKFFPNRSQFLAMSTPRSVELDKGIATAVSHQFLEVLSDCHLHWSIILRGHRLGFDERLQLAVDQIFCKLQEVLNAVILYYYY